MNKIIGQYPFYGLDINKEERKIFLQLMNAVNDLDFENFNLRGAIFIYHFERDDLGYSLSFDGFLNLRLVFNISNERYYFRYIYNNINKLVDVLVLKNWEDIDDWINGKQFNISDISRDEGFRKIKNDS